MKMYSCGKSIMVCDRGVWKEFDNFHDAWALVFLNRDIRGNVKPVRMWKETVRSLVPGVMKKTVRINIER